MEMNLEADLSYSDSEDEIKIPIPIHQETKIPEEFSVDNLLKERKNNPIIPRSYSFKENSINEIENSQNPQSKISNLFSAMQLNSCNSKDGSIFQPTKNNFPSFIFEAIGINEAEEESLFLSFNNQIPNYLIKCFQYYPDQIPPSLDLFIAYAHYIASNNILDSNMALLKYSQLLPQNSIDYRTWRSCLIYSIKHSLNAIFSLFSVCNFFLFKFPTQEQADNSRMEIFLLFFAMICTTDIIEHKHFSLILHQMRSCLIETDFDLSQINFVVKMMCDIFYMISIEMISSIVSLYPIDGIGAIILHNFSIRIIFSIFDLKFNDDDQALTIENLSNEIYRIQFLCNSDDDNDLKKASAVLALTERALISAFQFTTIPNDFIIKMIKSLQFTIKNSDLGLLTQLKEQIHFTRSQLEMLTQNTFKPSDQSNMFFET